MGKKKAAKKVTRRREASTAVLDEDESFEDDAENDATPTLAEARGDDEDEDEPISLMEMPPEMQEAYMADLRNQGRPEDADIAQSRINAQRRREGQRTAELIRLEPDEDEEGIPIKGVQHTFTAPFTDITIRRWAGKHLGGGKYEILYYGDKHQWLNRERFHVPGIPTPWRKQRKSIDDEEESVRREVDQVVGVASERESALQAQLDEMRQMLVADRRQKTEDEKERRHREELVRLEAKIEAAGANKGTNLPELITALGTAVAPLVGALSARMEHTSDNRGEMKDILAANAKASSDSRAQVMEVMALQNKGGSKMEDAMSTMMMTIMAERMKPQQDPQIFAFDMLKRIIPQAVTSSLEMAQAAAAGGNGDEGMLGKVFEMVSPLLERATGAGLGGPQPMAPPGLPMAPHGVPMAPPPGYAPVPPQGMPPQGVPAHMAMHMAQEQEMRRQAAVAAATGQAPPQAGQYPYSQVAPRPPVPGAPQPMPQPMPMPVAGAPMPVGAPPRVAPVQAPMPYQGVPQPMPQPMPQAVPPPQLHPGPPMPPPPPLPHGQLPSAPMPVPAPVSAPAPQDATNTAEAHINPNLFIMLESFIREGKTGDELAEVVDKQIETVENGQQAGPPLLSKDAIGFMEQFPPAAISGRLWEACPPELMPRFQDPATGQIPPHVQEFVLDFLHFYFDDDEDEAAAAATGATAALPSMASPSELAPTPVSAPEPAPVAVAPPEGV